jgi:Xaa-Pro aminopeptidase
MSMRLTALIAGFATLALAAPVAAAQAGKRLDVEAAQGLLAVQALDGWLLYQANNANSIAEELVGPSGATRPWFYLIPAEGKPTALVHASDTAAFSGVPGEKVTYRSVRAMRGALRKLLKGADSVAMEYAPDSKIASLNRVDGGIVRAVVAAGVEVTSSAQLVQFTKSLWGADGRVAHYVVAHHLDKIAASAMKTAARKVAAGEMVTEFDVQQDIIRRFKRRGIEAPSSAPPVVAAGTNTADPRYRPSAGSAAVIKKGDLLLIELAGTLASSPRPIAANITAVGCVCAEVPERYRELFAAVVAARDATIDAIRKRVGPGTRPMQGFEADEVARAAVTRAGHADKLVHPTGHSLDTSVAGDGANLDATARDTRNLVVGSGFTVGPGLYRRNDFGIRSEVGVFLGAGGLEVTSTLQKRIPALLRGR